MKAYMAYSRGAGQGEGCCLVIAHNIKEAKKTAWKSNSFLNDICDGYFDLVVKLLRESELVLPLANQEKLKADETHLIESPEYCEKCEFWGNGLTDEGLCGECNEYPGDRLIKCFQNFEK